MQGRWDWYRVRQLPTYADQRGRSPANRKSLEEVRANQMIREAENARARVFDVPGKSLANVNIGESGHGFGTRAANFHSEFVHSAMVDEMYLSASHVDESIVRKIVSGEFVDFGHLITRDQVLLEQQEDRIEIVNKNGQPYLVPVKDNTSINSFGRW